MNYECFYEVHHIFYLFGIGGDLGKKKKHDPVGSSQTICVFYQLSPLD
jgi:hypothetical protein